ncbi:MAG: D-alanyl-D-alanine carboxypeptidase, partial [Bdellovibrionota bacterium]
MHKRFLYFFIIFSWVSFSIQAEGGKLESEAHSIAFSKINEILKPYGAKAALSVRNLRGKIEYSHNSLGSYPPASLAKIFSSACVLNELGPDFRFETPWSYRGKIEGSTLEGDVIVSGSGDFSFVIEDLKMIVEYIRFALGIKSITGKLIFETQFLSKPFMSFSDDFNHDRGRAFSTAITAAPINHNAFAIWVIPEKPRPRIE